MGYPRHMLLTGHEVEHLLEIVQNKIIPEADNGVCPTFEIF